MPDEERHGEGGGSSQLDALTGVVVPTCFWEGCDNPAHSVERLALVPPGSRVARNVNAPLCVKHQREWRRTGRLNLFTHPDNLIGM